IPKYDGDFGSPNFFSSLTAAALERKVALLTEHFPSQATKPWFTPDLFKGVARIRGMECTAPEGFAEGFYGRKARFRPRFCPTRDGRRWRPSTTRLGCVHDRPSTVRSSWSQRTRGSPAAPIWN